MNTLVLRYYKANQKKCLFLSRALLSSYTEKKKEDSSVKIEKLYRDAFALTKGRPSAALLKALEQQAIHDGVMVTERQKHTFEFNELVMQNKSKVRKFSGPKSTQIGLLNAYLDIFLSKNQLDNFLDMLQRNTDVSVDDIDESIILRYLFKCREAAQAHHLEINDELKLMAKLLGYFFSLNIIQLKALSCNGINQEFVDQAIAKYSFYPDDFKNFEWAIKIIDPSISIDVSRQKIGNEALANIYPLTKTLLSDKPNSKFPFENSRPPNAAVETQLTNEVEGFTQLHSVADKFGRCQKTQDYKSNLQRQWTKTLHEALLNELYLYKSGDHNDFRGQTCPYLEESIVSLKSVAEKTINYVIEQLVLQYHGIAIIISATDIGDIVYKLYCNHKNHKHTVFDKSEYMKYLDDLKNNPHLSPQNVLELRNTQKYHRFVPYWNSNVIHGIGGFLLNMVRIHTTFNEEECAKVLGQSTSRNAMSEAGNTPVFTHTYHISDTLSHKYPIGTFVTHPAIKEIVDKSIHSRGYFYFNTTEVPMLCPPKPWKYHSLSPMLHCNIQFIRYAGLDWSQYFSKILDSHDKRGHIEVMKYGLDILGTLPWKVNTEVLQKQIQVYNEGGDGGLSIACVFDKTFPAKPDPNEVEPEAMKHYYETYAALKKEQDEKYSLRCTQLYTLSIANQLAGAPFWQCYNLDFRGRVYPVANHFSQMLGDPARGMLMFNEGAPLGPDGLSWLKIHCATAFGELGKASCEDKERFIDAHLDEVLESADKLCSKTGWWSRSNEDPWQCLAACIELSRALRSPDPAHYVTSLPVHMDGSCNGLQHYAALGRDVDGAVKVNVAPSDKPQDVYMAVLDIVLALQKEDISAGDETARKVAGLVTRKTLKQTVMTQVYGVTQFGAREQIKGRLQDKGMSSPEASECARYLATLTFRAVGQLFTQAQKIQDWLNYSAYHIAENGKPVQWKTPLGLPCVQPYTKNKSYRTNTAMQAIYTRAASPDMPVNKRKQRSAFPPNFVHSQDSTHMLMTAIECYHAGIPFAAVHDSFWTLPCHVTKMNEILRQQFILMYSFDVLKQLKESFEAESPELVFQDLPSSGDLDINCVKDSQYFFC